MCIIPTNTWLKWLLQKRVDSGKRARVLFDHFALMASNFGVDGAILTENLIEPEFDEGRLTILYNS
jgi:hypothetical protein